MHTEQFDASKWEPFVNKMANGFSNIAKLHKATCSNSDLKQEAWLALLKANKGFDPSKGVKFITYAYTYVYYELQKYVKRQTKLRGKVNAEINEDICDGRIDANLPSISGIGMVECRDFIEYVTSELTDHERTLIEERFFNEARVKDIADITNVSSATISQHLDKTIEKMRRTMRREGK